MDKAKRMPQPSLQNSYRGKEVTDFDEISEMVEEGMSAHDIAWGLDINEQFLKGIVNEPGREY